MYVTAPRGTTKDPIKVWRSLLQQGRNTDLRGHSGGQRGNQTEINDIPIRDIEELDSLLDRSARGPRDKWKGKSHIGLRDFNKQESVSVRNT